jgi:carbon monoxide dehydrogenase subunit G
MEMTGEQHILADRDSVWNALNDPEVLKACIPGCDAIEKQDGDAYKISMLTVVGPIKARFNGKLTISDSNPPDGYSLSFEGSGGAAGFGKGGATVSLTPAEPGTLLAYTAAAQVGGKLAQVGSRLIDGVAKKMASDFFERFNAQFAAPAASAAVPAPALAAASVPGASGAAATVNAGDSEGRAAAAPTASSAGPMRSSAWKAAIVLAVAIACAVAVYALNAR